LCVCKKSAYLDINGQLYTAVLTYPHLTLNILSCPIQIYQHAVLEELNPHIGQWFTVVFFVGHVTMQCELQNSEQKETGVVKICVICLVLSGTTAILSPRSLVQQNRQHNMHNISYTTET
jgi:hypothetical protein